MIDNNLPAERDANGRWLPGHKPMGGRPKGSKDRMTKLRELLLDEWTTATVSRGCSA